MSLVGRSLLKRNVYNPFLNLVWIWNDSQDWWDVLSYCLRSAPDFKERRKHAQMLGGRVGESESQRKHQRFSEQDPLWLCDLAGKMLPGLLGCEGLWGRPRHTLTLSCRIWLIGWQPSNGERCLSQKIRESGRKRSEEDGLRGLGGEQRMGSSWVYTEHQ